VARRHGRAQLKLGLNYAPGFVAQRTAAALGYQPLLWVLGETVAEAGAMNVFAVFERPDGGKFGRLLSNATYKAN
jgi:branched-chain amino acid aminotransferase